jgi:hypothetical protein
MNAHDGDGVNPAAASKRRRRFLAARNESVEVDDFPVQPEEMAFPLKVEEDDIPTLTDEVVDIEEEERAAPPAGETPPVRDAPPVSSMPAAPGKADVEELAAQMARAIDRQMAYELPTLIEASLLNVVAELRAGIASTMEAALRDFVERHESSSTGGEDETNS